MQSLPPLLAVPPNCPGGARRRPLECRRVAIEWQLALWLCVARCVLSSVSAGRTLCWRLAAAAAERMTCTDC
jgi:hypothetical protein